MGTVQFRANKYSQIALREPARNLESIGGRRKKITTQTDEHLLLSRRHAVDRTDRIDTVLARRLELELLAECVQERVVHLLEDSHRAVALHVAMAPHAQRPRVGFADVAANQQQVYQFADIVDGIAVLRQSHGPADHQVGLVDQHLSGDRDLGLADAARFRDLLPTCVSKRPTKVFKARRMIADEIPIDGALFKQVFAQALQYRNVAVDAHLQEDIGNCRAVF